MDKKIPEGFTLSLAIVDCLPVIFFMVALFYLSVSFKSSLFLIASILIILAGFLKCLWKFIIGLAHKNIPLLFYQMRVLMPLGFVLLVISLWRDGYPGMFLDILHKISKFPNVLFLIMSFIGMILMMYFAIHLDTHNAKHNWIEQITNTITQFCIMLVVIL